MGKRGHYRKVIGKGRDLGPTEEEMQLFLDRKSDAKKPEPSRKTENNGSRGKQDHSTIEIVNTER